MGHKLLTSVTSISLSFLVPKFHIRHTPNENENKNYYSFKTQKKDKFNEG